MQGMQGMQELNIANSQVRTHFQVGKFYKMSLQPKDDFGFNQEKEKRAHQAADNLNREPHQVDYLDDDEISFKLRPNDVRSYIPPDGTISDEVIVVDVPDFKFIKFEEIAPPLGGGRTRKSKKSRHTLKAKTSKKARKTIKGKRSKRGRKSRRHH